MGRDMYIPNGNEKKLDRRKELSREALEKELESLREGNEEPKKNWKKLADERFGQESKKLSKEKREELESKMKDLEKQIEETKRDFQWHVNVLNNKAKREEKFARYGEERALKKEKRELEEIDVEYRRLGHFKDMTEDADEAYDGASSRRSRGEELDEKIKEAEKERAESTEKVIKRID